MTKRILLAVILSILSVSMALAGPYEDMNSYINDNNINTPVHAAVGIGGVTLGKWLYPKSIKEPYRTILVIGSPILFALADECFNENFNWGDVGETAGFAIGAGLTFKIIDIDF